MWTWDFSAQTPQLWPSRLEPPQVLRELGRLKYLRSLATAFRGKYIITTFVLVDELGTV